LHRHLSIFVIAEIASIEVALLRAVQNDLDALKDPPDTPRHARQLHTLPETKSASNGHSRRSGMLAGRRWIWIDRRPVGNRD
jgi:hypothetical protein